MRITGHMTLQQLKYAAGVARSLSINEAASKLYISQPSLSTAIRDLEQEIGIRIFDRSRRGITVTAEGAEFLGYARQILEQAELLETRYTGKTRGKQLFSVSTQHYAFAVNAFVGTIRELGLEEYECTLRETKTHDIIEDVTQLKSDIGILYTNDFNRRVLYKVFHDNKLVFHPLFTARPHIFVSAVHPLALKEKVSVQDLEPWPCLSFEQGEHNSFHYSEEILSTRIVQKSIRVSDRATLFNLLIGLDGYTISTGVLTTDLNGNAIVSVPLESSETITVGWISREGVQEGYVLSRYLEKLKELVGGEEALHG